MTTLTDEEVRRWISDDRSHGVNINSGVLNDLAGALLESRTKHLLPMVDAPKRGEILIMVNERAGSPYRWLVGHYMPGGHCIDDHPPIQEGWYFWNGLMFDRASEPVGWLPLPSMVSA